MFDLSKQELIDQIQKENRETEKHQGEYKYRINFNTGEHLTFNTDADLFKPNVSYKQDPFLILNGLIINMNNVLCVQVVHTQ